MLLQLTEPWELWFGRLQAYAREHGDCLVPNAFVTADGHKLGSWVSRQRKLHSKGKLSGARVSRLEAEQRRLADSSSQLAALEVVAEADQATLRARQTDEEAKARTRRDRALSALPAARVNGSLARPAWCAAFAHAKLTMTWQRHERELDELEERLHMLHSLRESRDALDWRVTQTKAATSTSAFKVTPPSFSPVVSVDFSL